MQIQQHIVSGFVAFRLRTYLFQLFSYVHLALGCDVLHFVFLRQGQQGLKVVVCNATQQRVRNTITLRASLSGTSLQNVNQCLEFGLYALSRSLARSHSESLSLSPSVCLTTCLPVFVSVSLVLRTLCDRQDVKIQVLSRSRPEVTWSVWLKRR